MNIFTMEFHMINEDLEIEYEVRKYRKLKDLHENKNILKLLLMVLFIFLLC